MGKKKKSIIHTVVAICCIMTAACSGAEEHVSPADEIVLSETSASYETEGINTDSNGGSTAVSFTTNQDWTASVSSDQEAGENNWCHVKPTEGKAGSGSLTITLVENENYEERTATVKLIAGKAMLSIKVTQAQKDIIQTTPAIVAADHKAQDITITVKANVLYDVKIAEESQSWITQVESKSVRSVTTQELTFHLTENNLPTIRGGEISFSNGSLTASVKIDQKGKE